MYPGMTHPEPCGIEQGIATSEIGQTLTWEILHAYSTPYFGVGWNITGNSVLQRLINGINPKIPMIIR
jgi:hypothetical protein